MLNKTAIAAVCLAGACLVNAAGDGLAPAGWKKYFHCAVPAQWASAGNDEFAASGAFSVRLTPAAKNQLKPVYIELSYYANGSKLHKDSAQFIKKHTSNPLKLAAKKVKAVLPAQLAGLKAKAFERSAAVYLPPENPKSAKVEIREKFIVADGKNGFYVLHYYAAADNFDKYLPVFEAVDKSVKILP